MSLALYRKYRPESFAEVVGQEHVTEPLQQAIRNGRVHHAYLFSGPRGCGKTTSARVLARSLNCVEGPTPDPCGSCDSCVALAPNGPGSIDVIEIDAASHGGVDDARELRERAFFSPVSSRFKIYVIDEAHMVSKDGFNALLKLVEEPPEHIKLVFCTTEPEKVIGTIRSRTHHYPFRLMAPQALRGLLAKMCEDEGIDVEPAVLPLVVRAGAGSARDALSILDQLLAGAGADGVSYKQAIALLGYTDENLLDQVIDAMTAGDGATVFETVDQVISSGHDPRRFAADLLQRLRDLVVLAAVPDVEHKGLIEAPPDQLERMRGQADRGGAAALTRAADIVSAALTEMRGATAPRLLLELMCGRLLLPEAAGGEAALAARLDRLERRLRMSGAAPADQPAAGGPGAGQAAARGPGAGQVPAGAPTAGQPAAGGPTAGQAPAGSSGSGSGQAAAGGPGSGPVAASGGPAAGGAGSGQTAAGGSAAGSGAGQAPGGQAAGEAAAGGPTVAQGQEAGGPGGGQVPAGGLSAGQVPAGGPGGGQVAAGAPDVDQAAAGGSAVAHGQASGQAPASGHGAETAAAGGAAGAPDADQAAAGGSAAGGSGAGQVPGGSAAGEAGAGGSAATQDQASGQAPASGHGAGPAAAGGAAGAPGAGQAQVSDPASGPVAGADQVASGPAASGPGAGHAPAAGQGASGPGAGQAPAAGQAPGGAAAGQAPAGGSGARGREVTDVSELRRMWPEVLEAVKARRRFAWMVLDGKAQVASVEGNVLRLAFGREGDAKGFSQNDCDTVLREALAETLGVDWRIEAFAGSAPAAAPASPPPAPADPGPGVRPAQRNDVPPPPDEPEPEPDYPDVDGDERVEPNAAAGDDGLTGLPLLERELGARVIDEPPEPGAS